MKKNDATSRMINQLLLDLKEYYNMLIHLREEIGSIEKKRVRQMKRALKKKKKGKEPVSAEEESLLQMMEFLGRYDRRIKKLLSDLTNLQLFNDLLHNRSVSKDFIAETVFLQAMLLDAYSIFNHDTRTDLKTAQAALQKLRALLDKAGVDLAQIEEVAGKEGFKSELFPYTEVHTLAKAFSTVFSEEKDIEQLLLKVKKEMSALRGQPWIKKCFSEYKRRDRFAIPLNKIDKDMHGKIHVVIRHNPTTHDVKQAAFVMLAGARKFGSVEEYIRLVKVRTAQALDDMLRKNKELFTDVMGKQMNFTLYIDIEVLSSSNALANVGQTKRVHGRTRKGVRIIAYDPTNATAEINVNAMWLLKQVLVKKNVRKYGKILTHEFGHLFDKTLVKERHQGLRERNLDMLRTEGLATFTEYAYHGGPLGFSVHKHEIEALMAYPLFSKGSYGLMKMRSKLGERFPYEVGAFMCYIFFLATLVRRHKGVKKKELVKSLFNPRRQESLINFSKYRETAQLTARAIRGLDTKQFFKLYLKYSKEMGIDPVISKRVTK